MIVHTVHTVLTILTVITIILIYSYIPKNKNKNKINKLNVQELNSAQANFESVSFLNYGRSTYLLLRTKC